jgi:hypothetical protein
VKTTDVRDGFSDSQFLNFVDGLQPHKLSIAQFKKVSGLDSISEDVALKIIDELYQLSILTYGLQKMI